MGGVLRVDPARLRTAAAAQNDVGTYVAAMATGPSMADAGTGMAGLLVEGACRFAATMFDTAASAVYEELTAHSTNLSAAADRYHHTDGDLGRRLSKIAK
ncbi:type VII secretion target [Mycolicibacterium hodleri]|uniref:type VII secretion target n=1 Tax=Mycolicibacterium hodleri TaxID=49897 RepID=UPI0021F34EC9|nr:type VII secretion target [Mycolicibacterium hodleri]